MTSRLTSEVFIPSLPIVMPSEMAMVLNSIGLAPAALIPALSGAASSRSPKLQGMVSVQQLETPTNGFSMSAAGEADGVKKRAGRRAVAALVQSPARKVARHGRKSLARGCRTAGPDQVSVYVPPAPAS